MKSGKVTIVNELGLHARASSKLIDLAKSYPCSVELGTSEDEMVNAKSIMNVMSLIASQGTELILRTDGEEHEEAFEAIFTLIADGFGEVD